MTTRLVVPNDASAVQTFAADYMERYGLPPFAGGEIPGAAAPAAPAAAPAPAPAPAAPAAVAPAPAAAPAAPAAAPAAVAPAGEPVAPGAPAAADPPPDWAQQLIDGMGRLAPPAPVDPLAYELGLVPPPSQPPAAAPGYDPSQVGQAAGLPQPGGLPQPQAQPGQVQVVPGQPVPPQPGTPQAELEAVNRLIEEKALAVAEKAIQERVMPRFQQDDQTRRRQETQDLLNDYPELKDPAKQAALIAQARSWAQETLGNPNAAAEPGYLETVHLGMKGLEAAAAAKAAAEGNPAAAGEVPIEGGGPGGAGAVPQTSEQRAQAIVDAKPGGGLSDVWI